MGTLLAVLAVILVVWGLVALIKGAILFGLILIVIGCALGPGGWSVYRN